MPVRVKHRESQFPLYAEQVRRDAPLPFPGQAQWGTIEEKGAWLTTQGVAGNRQFVYWGDWVVRGPGRGNWYVFEDTHFHQFYEVVSATGKNRWYTISEDATHHGEEIEIFGQNGLTYQVKWVCPEAGEAYWLVATLGRELPYDFALAWRPLADALPRGEGG